MHCNTEACRLWVYWMKGMMGNNVVADWGSKMCAMRMRSDIASVFTSDECMIFFFSLMCMHMTDFFSFDVSFIYSPLHNAYWHYLDDNFTGGPGLEPPYRPRVPMSNHQKIMSIRPNYPGMMSNLQSSVSMMGMDNKQYPIGFKPQPTMPQGQSLRQQLQVRLVSLITDIETPTTKKHQLREV